MFLSADCSPNPCFTEDTSHHQHSWHQEQELVRCSLCECQSPTEARAGWSGIHQPSANQSRAPGAGGHRHNSVDSQSYELSQLSK